MVRTDLSEELINAGLSLLLETDRLSMRAQGAMWVYSHVLSDWRYYLVTSLVDSAGRRKAYQLLIKAFEVGCFPKQLTIEDVHLGSPKEQFFKLISGVVAVNGGVARFENCKFNDVPFDGVIYRSVQETPPDSIAKAIQREFERSIDKQERHPQSA